VESEVIYPAKQFVTSRPTLEKAMVTIEQELAERLEYLRQVGKLLEAQRLEQRTRFDLEMMTEVGYCSGIENYSRHIAARPPGSRPYCLLDYYPKDFLLVVDESHASIPQIAGMWHGDRSRKTTLVEHGFRLPSALDNRPLTFEEWEEMVNQIIFVSATPGDYELKKCNGIFVEQVIRPTGLVDPEVMVRPVKHQIDDLIAEIRERSARKERSLTTLTKRMAEDLTEYLRDVSESVYSFGDRRPERVEMRDLRLGAFDVVGVNLSARLDLPEVSLSQFSTPTRVPSLDRSSSRQPGEIPNLNGRVILYADTVTGSMQRMLDETNRRREKQFEYNALHNIVPRTVYKTTEEVLASTSIADVKASRDVRRDRAEAPRVTETVFRYLTKEQKEDMLEELRVEMRNASRDLEFERAAGLRDEIARFEAEMKG
jgi:excinuclease ABC subunit B